MATHDYKRFTKDVAISPSALSEERTFGYSLISADSYPPHGSLRPI